jgi:hypothetical protein
MSKFAKVQMLDVLVKAGYDIEKSVDACKYPRCESITALEFFPFSPPAPEKGDFFFTFDNIEREEETETLTIGQSVEVDFIPGITTAYFALPSNLLIKYQRSKVDSQYVSINDRIRPTPTWPVPKFMQISN